MSGGTCGKDFGDLEIFALVGQPRWHHGLKRSSAESGDEELRLAGNWTSQTSLFNLRIVFPSPLLHLNFCAS